MDVERASDDGIYAPCVRPASDLRPIMISDLKLDTPGHSHYRGTRILLRVRSPPDAMTNTMETVEDEEGDIFHEDKGTAIVVDEQGTIALFEFFNHPYESSVELLRPGRIFILKEPFVQCDTNGQYSLTVNHPSDIIWLHDANGRVPLTWRLSMLAVRDRSPNLRMQGNDAVKEQNWLKAERLYSSAIRGAETLEERQLAYLNRSFVNLKLGRPEKALSDAAQGNDAASPSEKGLFREARAHYELGNFDTCLEKLQMLKASYPGNTTAEPEIERVKARLHEQKTGEYSFSQMYKQASQTPPLVDCATFSAALEIRPSPGKGMGLFTTRPVSAGQLLLCEKAFAYRFSGDDQPSGLQAMLTNSSTKKKTPGRQTHLLTQVVQKLYHNPGMARQFRDLYHGDYTPVAETECDGYPVVDVNLVTNIMSHNGFGASRTSKEAFFSYLKPDTCFTQADDKDRRTTTLTTSGVWLLASRINHSCVDNCCRSFIGDMMIIRATRDLPADTELRIAYHYPESLESYEETQKRLTNWGFNCDCKLCIEKRKTSQEVLNKRRSLHKELEASLHAPTNIPEAQSLLKRLEENYPKPGPNSIRLELWDIYRYMGVYFVGLGKPVNSIKATVKGLEALGFSITAYPVSGGLKKPQLEIEKWGLSSDCTVWALISLFRAYEKLAPELCAVAKRYIHTAYMMAVGEGETMVEQFPKLA